MGGRGIIETFQQNSNINTAVSFMDEMGWAGCPRKFGKKNSGPDDLALDEALDGASKRFFPEGATQAEVTSALTRGFSVTDIF